MKDESSHVKQPVPQDPTRLTPAREAAIRDSLAAMAREGWTFSGIDEILRELDATRGDLAELVAPHRERDAMMEEKGGMAQCDSVSETGRRCGLAPGHAPYLHMDGGEVHYWEDDGEEHAGAAAAVHSMAARLKETEARCEALESALRVIAIAGCDTRPTCDERNDDARCRGCIAEAALTPPPKDKL